MAPFLDGLPSILVLAALVGTFLSLRKHAPSSRIRLWTYAWALILVHFCDRLFGSRAGAFGLTLGWLDVATLELSGIVFSISLIRAVENRRRRIGLLLLLVPTVALHSLVVTFGWNVPWILAGLLALIFLGSAAFCLLARSPVTTSNIALATVLIGTGIWAIHAQLHGNSDPAINSILTLGFGLCGILYWKRYPRLSPGVITTTAGFYAWGAIWPICAFLAAYSINFPVNPELWNVPKFFVAFGMILTLIEDKSSVIEDVSERERAENQLLLRLSQITSRLLAGKDPATLCEEIAAAIAQDSTFRRAAIFLANETHSVYLAGSSGFQAPELAQLHERSRKWTLGEIKEMRSKGSQVGNNSFRISEALDEVLIPLVSGRGSHLGFLWVMGAKNKAGAETSEVVKLEMLAADLAVTIENSWLHDRVVRSEKLAALGQLVAGVAHELNNPLTGIIGYAELLGDEVEKDSTIKRVQKLANEAQRMKRIVDGLLRFARQSNLEARASDLESALHDIVQLREFHLRKRGIHIEVHVDPMLPRLGIGEDELKQILLNILNNAVDAVEDSAKREIRVRAFRHGTRVAFRFQDSGPGFTDLNRAFDPFYTTKPVGKGTGLGLSICYGIVKECKGEIVLANTQPYGASVTVELPSAAALAKPLLPAIPA